MKKIKVLCLAPTPTDATSLYRACAPFGHLHRNYPDEIDVDFYETKNITPEMWPVFSKYNVCFMQRPFLTSHVQLLAAMKSFGLPVVVDYDDDLTCLNRDNPRYKNYMNKEVQENLKLIATFADAIICATEHLANKWSAMFDVKTNVVNNAIDAEWFRVLQNQKPEQKNIITWRGGDTHTHDLEMISKQLINVVNESDYKLCMYGLDAYFISDHIKPDKLITGNFHLLQYFSKLYNLGGKIGIVPITNTMFNKSKSNIAYIELVMTGHCVLASDMPEFKRTESLIFQTPDEFENKLNFLINNPDAIEALHRKQIAQVKQQYLLEKVNYKRLDILQKVSR